VPELAAAQDILNVALREAQAQGARRVRAIAPKLGRLYAAERIESLFGMLAKGSIAEGARLEIEQMPGSGLQVGSLEVEWNSR